MEQNVALEHALPPAAEQIVVGVARGIAVIADRPLGEPHLRDRPHAHHVGGQAVAVPRFSQSLVESARTAREQRFVLSGRSPSSSSAAFAAATAMPLAL
jgi:hypothetical protein